MLRTRVKEGDNRLSDAIERAQIAALETVTLRAGKAEIDAFGYDAVLFGDDVVDLVGEEAILLMDAAVFAALRRPVGDFAAQGVGDAGGHACCASFSWARIFRRAMRLSNWI